MKKLLLIVAAILLLVPVASFAAPIALSGTYSLSFTATGTGDSNSGVLFSSTPGDGCLAPCTNNLGTQTSSTITSGITTNNYSFGSGGASGNVNLTVGSATQLNFFTAQPNPSGTGTGACVAACGGTTTYDKHGNPIYNSDNLLVGTITANFTFSEGGATGTLTGVTAAYSANYTGSLSCDAAGTTSFADCVDWTGNSANGNSPVSRTHTGVTYSTTYDVAMSNGDTLAVTLKDASDWNITPLISFALTPATTTGTGGQKVPEPASLAVLGSAAVCLGFLRRRKAA